MIIVTHRLPALRNLQFNDAKRGLPVYFPGYSTRTWYILRSIFFKNLFDGGNIAESDIGINKLLLTDLVINNVVYQLTDAIGIRFVRLLEAASTESAIISTAVSLLNGRGPGYLKSSSSTIFSG